jgi:hypothetical protein
MSNNDSVRVGVHSGYADIARHHWDSVCTSKSRLDALLPEGDDLADDEALEFDALQLRPIRHEIDEHCVISIVFSAMTVESYIFDYAARRLSDSCVVDHLEKLDVVSKWVITPMLVTGKPFPKDKFAFELLKRLVANRNSLVHGKSVPFMTIDQKTNSMSVSKKAQELLDFQKALFEKARDAILALDEIALVIEGLDPDESTSFALGANVGRRKRHIDRYGM